MSEQTITPEPGRALDREIAVRVFGTDAPHAIMAEYDLPWFSTDILCAWRIVEHLSFPTDRCFFEINVDANGWWMAEFGAGWFKSPRVETAPHAICLAALEYALATGRGPAPNEPTPSGSGPAEASQT